MANFPSTHLSRWGEGGTEGGPWASFALRYQRPLERYAALRFGLGAELAEELAARFLAAQLSREGQGALPLFRLYEPGRGRFRSLLATAFWRFVRDELEKERRRSGVDLDSIPEPAEPEDDELCRLIARELFATVRERIAASLDPDERAFLDVKWPAGEQGEALSDAETERALGVTRGRVRSLRGRVGQAFVRELRALAEQSRLAPSDLIPLLSDTCQALDRDG